MGSGTSRRRDGFAPTAGERALRRERLVAGVLFFATCCSVFVVYLLTWQAGPVLDRPESASRALVFTVALMTILGAHELGHYGAARLHGIRVGLPWFLPAPLWIGTFGAIIRLREAPRTRSGLLEMGVAGPLAGFAATGLVTIAWAAAGPVVADAGVTLGQPLLFRVVGAAVGDAGLVPVPADPLGFAAWLGCLLTAMNLLPFGQLDGGHVAAALRPDAARRITVLVGLLVAGLGLLWPGWAAWVVLLVAVGAWRQADVRRPEAPPAPRARRLAVAGGLAWLATFTAVPVGWATTLPGSP